MIDPGRTDLRPLRRLLLVLTLAGGFPDTSLCAQDHAAAGPAKLPEFDRSGFTRIFDGETLRAWDGDPAYWTVQEGKLVGTVTPETLLQKNSWIVWRGALMEDFELVLDYRVSAEGNSGIGYRLSVLESDPYSVRGPQADIHGKDLFTGICYEENGRRLLAARGQSTWIDPGALPRLTAQRADPAELQGVVRPGDWNRYRLLVRGRHAQHYINGVLMSEVHDHDETNRMHQGLIGVQVHVGPPMTIEFRDMFVKHLGPPPEGQSDRGSVVYRSGSLLERDHAPTFDHLARQAARLTAPRVEEPVNGQTRLAIATRELGVVRHDLADVKLAGGSKPNQVDRKEFDLVVMSGQVIVRIPHAGGKLTSRPLDRDYRVELEWDRKRRQYNLRDLSEVDIRRELP